MPRFARCTPRLTRRIQNTCACGGAVAQVGTTLYRAGAGLDLFDVRSGAPVGSIGSANILELDVANELLAASTERSVLLYDVSESATPRLLVEVPLDSEPSALRVRESSFVVGRATRASFIVEEYDLLGGRVREFETGAAITELEFGADGELFVVAGDLLLGVDDALRFERPIDMLAISDLRRDQGILFLGEQEEISFRLATSGQRIGGYPVAGARFDARDGYALLAQTAEGRSSIEFVDFSDSGAPKTLAAFSVELSEVRFLVSGIDLALVGSPNETLVFEMHCE